MSNEMRKHIDTFKKFNLNENKQIKNFVKINFLDEILNSVKQYLPNDLKYIRIYNETVGFEQGSLYLKFYTSGWRQIQLDKDFNEQEQEIYGEVCLFDYISNSLVGMVQDCDLIDWKHSDEFSDKIKMDREYFYVWEG
jgi:hypothetical protein